MTAGGAHTLGLRDFVELFRERVRVELGRRSDVVINTAIGGSTIQNVADQLEHRITRFRPDAVFLGVGLNDARHETAGLPEFRTTYERVVAESGCVMVAQTPNGATPGVSEFVTQYGHEYADAIRTLAKELDLPLVDHGAVWDAVVAEGRSIEPWIGQGCHPNGYGHRVMAHTIFKALDIFAADSLTCRLPYPQ